MLSSTLQEKRRDRCGMLAITRVMWRRNFVQSFTTLAKKMRGYAKTLLVLSKQLQALGVPSKICVGGQNGQKLRQRVVGGSFAA
jgi:hypothetical protein